MQAIVVYLSRVVNDHVGRAFSIVFILISITICELSDRQLIEDVL